LQHVLVNIELNAHCVNAFNISRTHKLLALEDVAVVHVCRWVFGYEAQDFGLRRMDCTEWNRGQSAGVQHEL